MNKPKNTKGAKRPAKPDASCPECGYKRVYKSNCKRGKEQKRTDDETQKVVADKPRKTRRPFNPQQALSGAALETRDGRRATDFAARAHTRDTDTYPYEATVAGFRRTYTHTGCFYADGRESPLDLFMVDETVVESSAQETATSNAVDPLAKVVAALLRPTAEAMHAGGIQSLSMCDGKFVVQLESGQVYEGVNSVRNCDTPSHSAVTSDISVTSDRPAWQTRVIEEKAALDQKIKKLEGFVTGSSEYVMLTDVEQIPLLRQLVVMRTYSKTLRDRIAAW